MKTMTNLSFTSLNFFNGRVINMSYINYVNEVVKPQQETRGFKMSEEDWNKACSNLPSSNYHKPDFIIHMGNPFVMKRDLIIEQPMDIGGYVELSFDLTWGRGICLEVQYEGVRVKQWNFGPRFER